MRKSRINILIVEDDATQGRALQEAFSRAGYSVTLCDTSVQGLTQAQRIEFHALIVDCMLPRMNGIDLVEEVVPLFPRRPKVYMMTGIYKDRKFIEDTLARTKAEAFFVKPIDLNEMLGKVNEAFPAKDEEERPPLLQYYGPERPAPASLIDLIGQEPTLHAFHLPKLYQCIGEARLSGELNLISAVGDLSSISFYKGHVFAVKTPDRESYFGSLAISKGFVQPDDVLAALKNPEKKVLGQKLIESMSLSPHAINVILEEQLALRLSQTIQDDVVTVQWVTRQFGPPEFSLPASRLEGLLNDWLVSKVSFDWIHSTLMVWGAFELGGDYHAQLKGGHTVKALYQDPQFKPSRDLPPLFRALVLGSAVLGARSNDAPDFRFLESRVERLTQDFKQQNFFQFLGVGEKAHQREISKAYESLRDVFAPENLPEGCPPPLREKCAHVSSLIEKAYVTLSNDIERQRYMQTLENRRRQEALEAEPVFRAAIIELHSGRAREAALKFQSLIDRRLEFRDIRSYRLWAGLKADRDFQDLRLDQIPPEERHSSVYMMAKGIHHTRLGQLNKALEAFRTATVLDPSLTIAKNEIQRVMRKIAEMEKSEKTSVFENLFGKTTIKSKNRRGA